jgi:hypothetical protein
MNEQSVHLFSRVQRALALRTRLALVGYDLQSLARRFLAEQLVAPAEMLEEDLRHLARDGSLAEGTRHGCRGYAVAVRGLLIWYSGVKTVACEPLDVELARLKWHDDVLADLQQAAGPARVVRCEGDSCSAC